MKNPVDKRLADHIRQTLDDYQTPYPLGAWEQFDGARRQPKRRLIGWYRYAVAACLLGGMLVVPLWLGDAPWPEKGAGRQLATGPSGQSPQPLVITRSAQSATKATSDAPGSSLSIAPENSVHDHSKPVLATRPAQTTLRPSAPPLSLKPIPSGNPHLVTLQPVNNIVHGLNHLPPPLNPPVRPSETRSIGSVSQSATAPPASNTVLTNQSIPGAVSPAELAQEATTKPHRRTVQWSVALGPQSSYAQNSTSSLTLGGGIFSDISLGKRLSVSTGLALTQQQLGYGPPANRPATMLGRQLIATDARLLAVDLPVNLRYRIGRLEKPLFHLSTGLSSLAFLNESYTNTYQTLQPITTGPGGVPRPSPPTGTTQETERVSAGGFNRVYWGRLLNVSVGIERPLSKRSSLTVEPYLKYPLGSLTQENLRLGSAGVSLRVGVR